MMMVLEVNIVCFIFCVTACVDPDVGIGGLSPRFLAPPVVTAVMVPRGNFLRDFFFALRRVHGFRCVGIAEILV